MLAPRLHLNLSAFRAVTSWCCTLFFTLSILPIPIQPSLIRAPSPNERFPCENSPCGCRSADQCWRNCCCKTASEKIAWARDHGVSPPNFVVQAARVESNSQRNKTNCCCAKSVRNSCKSSPAVSKTDRRPIGQHVLLISALICKGKSLSFQALPVVVLGTSMKIAVIAERPLSIGIVALFYRGTSLEPATPPPRVNMLKA